jgi:hypothetical protein
MSAKSCVNSYCVGTNNVVFPVRNRPSNPGDTWQNPYPAYCTGTWWIDTRGSSYTSGCTTSWVVLDHCQRPNGALFSACPAVGFCGDGTTDAGEQCDSGAQIGRISLTQLCDDTCHRVELRTCINSSCSGTNSILTEVANTSTGQSNGGRKFYCKGSWTVSTYGTLYDSTCSTVWQEVF